MAQEKPSHIANSVFEQKFAGILKDGTAVLLNAVSNLQRLYSGRRIVRINREALTFLVNGKDIAVYPMYEMEKKRVELVFLGAHSALGITTLRFSALHPHEAFALLTAKNSADDGSNFTLCSLDNSAAAQKGIEAIEALPSLVPFTYPEVSDRASLIAELSGVWEVFAELLIGLDRDKPTSLASLPPSIFQYADAILALSDVFPRRRDINWALVLSVGIRAGWRANPGTLLRIRHFYGFLRQGTGSRLPDHTAYSFSSDNAVEVLRLAMQSGEVSFETPQAARLAFGAVQEALNAFLERREVTGIKPQVSSMLFPIPEDVAPVHGKNGATAKVEKSQSLPTPERSAPSSRTAEVHDTNFF